MQGRFGDRLRQLRTAAGMTQTELAEKAGLQRDAIARLEALRQVPLWPTVLALGKALGVSPDSFAQPAARQVRKKGRPAKVA